MTLVNWRGGSDARDRGAPVVRLRSGEIVGSWSGEVATFRGVPYAAPPVGELRLRAPQPVEPWEGRRPALSFGPVAPQPVTVIFGGVTPLAAQSEDCLSLNVWAPADADGAPVVVWIHGGSYSTGSGSVPDYDGRRWAREQGVVVVTINYRLGALGQMDFSAYSTESTPIDSNLGLRDQLAALRWVQDNIAAFGGDPDRVTIIGESAGGNSVTTLLAVPSAKGLFWRAVAQSAHPTSAHSRERKQEHAERLIRALGFGGPAGATVGEALKSVPVKTLVDAGMALSLEVAREHPGVLLFSPELDAELLPEHPIEAALGGRTLPVPLIIGTNAQESSVFDRFGIEIMPTSRSRIDQMLELFDREALDRVAAAYGDEHDPAKWLLVANDVVFRVPSINVAEGHAATAPTWMYRFDFASPLLRASGFGAVHGAELEYLFGNFGTPSGIIASASAGRRLRLRMHRVMSGLWTSFVRGETPAIDGWSWPQYDAESRRTLIIDTKGRVEDDPGREEREIWQPVRYAS